MPAYRLYVLNDSLHIEGSDIVEAETDAEAIEFARVTLHGRVGELWLADKKVCKFDFAQRP